MILKAQNRKLLIAGQTVLVAQKGLKSFAYGRGVYMPPLPPGYAFVVDHEGTYIVDHEDNYVIAKIS